MDCLCQQYIFSIDFLQAKQVISHEQNACFLIYYELFIFILTNANLSSACFENNHMIC